VVRYVAGLVSVLFLIIGAVLFWQARPDEAQAVPMPPPPQASGKLSPLPEPPEATPKSREEKRFGRADKDDDGRITAAELFEPRRKAFAKLDVNGNGVLSFEEWAVRTVDKFQGADKDRSGWLTPAEYATTAPKPPKRKARCSC
jgi:uncharacterized protein YxeA